MFTLIGIKKRKVKRVKSLGLKNLPAIKQHTLNSPLNMSVVLLKVIYRASLKRKPMPTFKNVMKKVIT
jgi:hypothetical protein